MDPRKRNEVIMFVLQALFFVVGVLMALYLLHLMGAWW